MKSYLDLLHHVLYHGQDRDDRTGVGTRGIFGGQIVHNLNAGFPLLTTKKVHFKAIAIELLWFLRGDTNIKWLQEKGVTIWDEWADEKGDLGPVYGSQWRDFGGRQIGGDGYDWGIDQIMWVRDEIIKNPNSRRLVVSAWNPHHLSDVKLPPCHCLFQFYVQDGKLSCHLYQRSGDIFLGVPFNIASYALLTHLMARATGLQVGHFVHSFGDLHLYKNHFEQAKEQLGRIPKSLPGLKLNSAKTDLFGWEYEDIELVDYNPLPAIKAPVAV